MLVGSELSLEIPLISVVLPVFNAEKYISDAVRSILNQTFSHFELILINDGSTDRTLEILEGFKEMDKRVLLFSRENKGLVASLNEGVDLASGMWVVRMDADDIALPHRFARQLEWLEQSGADICGSWVQFFGTSDKRILKHATTDEAIKMELLFGSSFSHPTVMMKTELVRQLRYDPDWDKAEDYELWIRAACAGWKMTNVPEVLLMYRQHATQISTASSVKQQELTQKIRHRYWEFVSYSIPLKKEWIDEVLKLREPLPIKPNMNDVDLAFDGLLKRSDGEAQAVIFEHATRLYFRAAAECPDVLTRWARFNRDYGEGFALATKIKLWVLSILEVNANGKMFYRLKKLYFYFVRTI